MKRKATRHSVELLLISLLALVAFTLCTVSESATAKQNATLPKAFQSNFIIQLISVQPDMDEAFVIHYRDSHLPKWQQFHSDGVVSSVNVFELLETESTLVETPPWSHLILVELDSTAAPEELRSVENELKYQDHSDSSLFTILRIEQMTSTPKSCYAMPEPTYPDAPSGIDYLMEIICIEESPVYLTKFRDLMINYFGPANGLLVERGMVHCFIALESTATLFEVPEAPAWNQIHISDDWDVGENVDWDAVYVDLFHREFSCELDSVWAEMPPVKERPTNYFGRLVRDLCVR